MTIDVFDQMSLATPAVVFPAMSLLLLAYTNRFLGLASLIRNLLDTYQDKPSEKILKQIATLRVRLRFIKWTQMTGTLSMLVSVVVMLQFYFGWIALAQLTFALSMLLLIVSLLLSLCELYLSNDALNISLLYMENETLNNPTQANTGNKKSPATKIGS